MKSGRNKKENKPKGDVKKGLAILFGGILTIHCLYHAPDKIQ